MASVVALLHLGDKTLCSEGDKIIEAVYLKKPTVKMPKILHASVF